MSTNILITDVGKTTTIISIASQLKAYHPSGFYTEEIRSGGGRKGFRIVTLDGRHGVLSHVDIKSRYRVGRYGVDIDSFENTALPVMDMSLPARLFVIDEIGKMECFSMRFIAQMQKLLDSDKIVLATVAKRGGGFIAQVKSRADVQIIDLTPTNRDTIPQRMVQTIDGRLRM